METSHPLVWLLGIGLRPEQLNFLQISLRAVIIFVVALALMRIGHKRSLARKTAFDTAFMIMVGAVLARAINGSGPFFPTMVGALVLVLLHRLLALVAYYSETFERLIKGQPDVIIRDGEFLAAKMASHKISPHDVGEDLRLHGHDSIREIAAARLERSGDISFVTQG